MSAAVDHAPLTRERHAAIVAYLCRYSPRAWRVLMAPTLYLYDDRDHILSVELEGEAGDLRIAFNGETDWRRAMKIIRRLLVIDATCCRMSVGSRIDGVDYYGEYVGADAT